MGKATTSWKKKRSTPYSKTNCNGSSIKDFNYQSKQNRNMCLTLYLYLRCIWLEARRIKTETVQSKPIVSDFFSSLPFSNAKSYTYCTILSKKAKATHQLSPQNTIILQDQRPILAEVETQSMTLTITQLRLGIAGKNYKQNKTWTKWSRVLNFTFNLMNGRELEALEVLQFCCTILLKCFQSFSFFFFFFSVML